MEQNLLVGCVKYIFWAHEVHDNVKNEKMASKTLMFHVYSLEVH